MHTPCLDTPTKIGMLLRLLPGPTRKREPRLYCFQITYRAPNDSHSGCLMTWDVQGGRELYQIALERMDNGQLRWHCTCADATFRGETKNGHLCKHVRGLLECSPPVSEAPDQIHQTA